MMNYNGGCMVVDCTHDISCVDKKHKDSHIYHTDHVYGSDCFQSSQKGGAAYESRFTTLLFSSSFTHKDGS